MISALRAEELRMELGRRVTQQVYSMTPSYPDSANDVERSNAADSIIKREMLQEYGSDFRDLLNGNVQSR